MRRGKLSSEVSGMLVLIILNLTPELRFFAVLHLPRDVARNRVADFLARHAQVLLDDNLVLVEGLLEFALVLAQQLERQSLNHLCFDSTHNFTYLDRRGVFLAQLTIKDFGLPTTSMTAQ